MRRAAVILLCLGLSGGTLAGAASGQQGGADDLVRLDEPTPAVAPTTPKLDDVFRSIRARGTPGDEVRAMPIAVAVGALALMAVTIGQWNRRRSRVRPRRVGDHKKLLDELARASGLSRRQMRRLMPAARAGGLSSPAVAAICPSVLLARAAAARSGTERSAWAALSRAVAGRRR